MSWAEEHQDWQPVTVLWRGGLIRARGVWESKYRRLRWSAPQHVEPVDPVTGRATHREAFEVNVETPGWQRGSLWAWGWDGAEALALRATLALELT